MVVTEIFLWIGVVFLVGSIDDLLIDLAHTFGGLKPKKVDRETWKEWRQLPEKAIAVMIPAWKEANVLEAMVKTNLSRIQYQNFKWFIGVYPNDLETTKIAKKLEGLYPNKIAVVVTDRPGPTSKAHCLNCILNKIEESVKIAAQEGGGWVPDYVGIHDAEDVIHPGALSAINALPADLDFIQVPIFSLPVPAKEWVAGTYLDEFAEIHLKEIPVRQLLKMPVPSAGVGTFLSQKILLQFASRFGYFFDESNLTEDYEISQRIARLGGKQTFLLVRDEAGEILSTREYFPDTLGRSIRQKTRWTTGIGLQTLNKWGRYGNNSGGIHRLRDLVTVYGLYRDRKALWANPLAFLGWTMCGVYVGLAQFSLLAQPTSVYTLFWLKSIFGANTALFGVRLLQRARFTATIYGAKHGLLAIPRVIPSNMINGIASMSAIRDYFKAKKVGQVEEMRWDKTDHKFPDLDHLPK